MPDLPFQVGDLAESRCFEKVVILVLGLDASDSKRYGWESSTYSFFLTQQILIVQTSVTIPLH
ncbi:hypothetical protein GYH30_016929 [Glycine max]|nr:hypothetical protein GYH30_016929 [Glycine max]